MKKTVMAIALLFFVTGLSVVAHAELESFLSSVNVQARADMNGFSVRLGAQFGVPVPQVQSIMRVVESPADAFMLSRPSLFPQFNPAINSR